MPTVLSIRERRDKVQADQKDGPGSAFAARAVEAGAHRLAGRTLVQLSNGTPDAARDLGRRVTRAGRVAELQASHP